MKLQWSPWPFGRHRCIGNAQQMDWGRQCRSSFAVRSHSGRWWSPMFACGAWLGRREVVVWESHRCRGRSGEAIELTKVAVIIARVSRDPRNLKSAVDILWRLHLPACSTYTRAEYVIAYMTSRKKIVSHVHEQIYFYYFVMPKIMICS